MAVLTPNYLSLDFESMKSEIILALKDSDTFKDYNFEGANITVLIELMSYLGDVNTFYMNRISKELYLDTVELYENAHRLSQLSGYVPLGYQTSSTDLKVTLTQDNHGQYFSLGDTIAIDRFKKMSATTETGNIKFITNDNYTDIVTIDFTDSGKADDLVKFEFDLPIKEGNGIVYNYTGADVSNNRIQLPFYQFDHTQVIGAETSVWLTVNNILWTRVNTFFEDISGIENEYNLYRLVFDKYKKYHIEFSANLNIPKIEDNIQISLIQTKGADGNVGANTIIDIDESEFIYNTTTDTWIPISNISITNNRASNGGSSYETLNELKANALAFAHSQYRCTTKKDYKSYLERLTTINKATAWGQQELQYQSDTRDYNKIYITIIPTNWGLSSISTETETWTLDNGNNMEILVPLQYLSSFQNGIEIYLEPYKMMNTYHSYELPELIYFALDVTITVYGNYTYASIITDIKNKLNYIFNVNDLNFGYSIDFRDIEKKILDTTIISSTDNFPNIAGIQYFKIRQIHTSEDVYEPNIISDYPQYKIVSYDSNVNNTLRTILLGPGQFPMFESSMCTFTNEG